MTPATNEVQDVNVAKEILFSPSMSSTRPQTQKAWLPFCDNTRLSRLRRSNAFVKYEPVHSHHAASELLPLYRNRRRWSILQEQMRDPGYILIVNNDPMMEQMVSGYFSDHNVPTSSASNWSELKSTDTPPSLIIMDQPLGQHDGLDELRSIRSTSDIPVIMTGDCCDEIDRIICLELGADDYIAKPFSPGELLARARAILRRREMTQVAPTQAPERGGYRFDGWRLELRARRLLDPDEVPVHLSKGEYALLLAFLQAPQRTLTRAQLLQAIRVHEDIFDRSIDVQVLRLRRKLEVDSSEPRMIQTERGIGYVFAVPVVRF
jgi:two-component system OmpR family response regulator